MAEQVKEAAHRSDSYTEELDSVVHELVPKKRARPILIGKDLDHQDRETEKRRACH